MGAGEQVWRGQPRGVRPRRWVEGTTLVALALLWVALGSLGSGLAGLIRDLEADLLVPVAVVAVLVGWGLGRSRLPGWLAGLLAAGLGGSALSVRVGRLGGPLSALLGSVARLVWTAVWLSRWSLAALFALDPTPVKRALVQLGDRAGGLLARVEGWVSALVAGRPAFDPIVTALAWSLAVWAVAVWAGWWVRRRDRPLLALAPAGVVLALTLYYTYAEPNALVLLVGATLALQVLRGHAARERAWQAARVPFASAGIELALVAAILSATLMVAGLLTPSLSVRELAQAVDRLVRGQEREESPVPESLGLEPRPARPVTGFDGARVAGLPRQHLLGSGPELSQRVVMWVHLEGYEPVAPEALVNEPPRLPPPYYWRGLTYDRYSGRGWYTSGTYTAEYAAGQPAITETVSLETPAEAGRPVAFHIVVRQRVQAVGRAPAGSGPAVEGLVYVAGELLTADQAYQVAWRAPGDAFGAQIGGSGGGERAGGELAALEGRGYWADSRVPLVSVGQLRSAGSDYPEWVQQHYLTLPDELPARVRDLALDLTASEPTPYDRARAIERYLRTFTYTLDLPAPPPGQDVADYFLFELQRGYCDYFATGLVVLARAAGVPARLVIGYASGTYDPTQARYVVSEADAHSWVEVYFPGYGWIEFEPTSGRPPIERPEEVAPPEVAALPPLAPVPSPGPRVGPRGWLAWLAVPAAMAVLAVGALGWWLADGWVLCYKSKSPSATVAALYGHLCRQGERLALPVDVGDTPYEFATRLADRVAEVVRTKRRETMLAPIMQDVQWLTDLYVRTLYSPHPPDEGEKGQAICAWRQLRRYLWRVWVWGVKRET